MADNIVGSLFGISPEQLMQQRQARDVEQQVAAGRSAALPGSMMSPSLAPFYQQAAQQGQLIGRGVGALLGSEDPELQKVTQIKQLSSQFDLTTPAGMRQFAQALQQIAPNEAMMAAKRADEMEQSGLTRQKTQADITKAELSASQEEKLRAELSALPPDAPDEQVISVVTKYGSADKILQELSRKQDRAAAREQKQALVDIKNYDKAQNAQAKVQAATDSADRIINTIQQAIPLVGYTTAGVAGAANVPGTAGRDLETALTTIKANLGFDRLQQMRDASKTGGALGNVAVKELEALQATIASLDRGQSPDKLKNNLKDIEYYYTRWRKAVNGEDPGPAVRSGEKPPAKTSGVIKLD